MTVVADETDFLGVTTYTYDVSWTAPYGSLQPIHYELTFC
jgi:hypothetical protein